MSETDYDTELPTEYYEVAFAQAQHIGFSSQKLAEEDHSFVDFVYTAGGLGLYLGIVADGFGGKVSGKPAALYVLDTVVNLIQNSNDCDIDALLDRAIQSAHQRMQRATAANVRLNTIGVTITIAAINSETMELHLAHLGDNRAYLVRKKNHWQLTQDHILRSEAVRFAGRSLIQDRSAAMTHMPSRYVGQADAQTLDIDMGIPEMARGEVKGWIQGGYPLEPGDVIVLCTNGLAEEQADTEQPLVKVKEIVRAVQKHGPEEAAEKIVNMALSRQVQDNVTTIVLESPGRKRGGLPLIPIIFSGLAALVLCIGAIFWLTRPQAAAALPTATRFLPSPTPPPTLDVNAGYAEVLQLKEEQLNVHIPGMEFQLTRGTRIPFGLEARLWTGDAPATLQLSDGAVIYLDKNTAIYLTQISLPGSDQPPTILSLEDGNLLAIASRLEVNSLTRVYHAVCMNGVMGVSYQSASDIFWVDCLDGNCQLSSRSTDPVEIQAGQGGGYQRLLPIPATNAKYDTWLALGGVAVPTPSPTPTPLPTDTPTITPMPTRTPVIATARPANTPSSNQPPSVSTVRPRPTKPPPPPDPGGG